MPFVTEPHNLPTTPAARGNCLWATVCTKRDDRPRPLGLGGVHPGFVADPGPSWRPPLGRPRRRPTAARRRPAKTSAGVPLRRRLSHGVLALRRLAGRRGGRRLGESTGDRTSSAWLPKVGPRGVGNQVDLCVATPSLRARGRFASPGRPSTQPSYGLLTDSQPGSALTVMRPSSRPVSLIQATRPRLPHPPGGGVVSRPSDQPPRASPRGHRLFRSGYAFGTPGRGSSPPRRGRRCTSL